MANITFGADGNEHGNEIDPRLLMAACTAADQWGIDHVGARISPASFTRGVVEEAVRYLIETGLLVPADDLTERLSGPLPIGRKRP